MNRRDWELLEKQLGEVSSRPPQNGIIMQSGINVLMMIAVFLVGMGIGDICLKQTKPIHITQL